MNLHSTRTLGVYDELGRYLGPADVVIQLRPMGPWDTNRPLAPLVTVCAWCPDATEQTAAARAHGHEVSHGICAACVARLEAEAA
jgi:mono/diheme cytochrome c family protein